jgi:hypothetical protein
MIMAIVLTTMSLAQEPGLHRVASAHGVTVYRHEGEHGIALAAEGDIAAPPDTVRRVLLDYTSHPKWNKHLAESRVLSRNADSLLVYQRLELPMISDRDFTLRVRWGDEGDTRWMQFSTENQHGPGPRDGVVRVQTHEGMWRLQPTADGRGTHATYYVHLDLAGSLPGWMGKSRAGKDVLGLFDQIRNQTRWY